MEIKSDLFDNIGKRISVEIGAIIKIELEDVDLPLQSSIVGFENGKYIIIKAPEPSARIMDTLKSGKTLSIRYTSGGSAFTFRANIIEIVNKPAPLLFLSYPESIERYDLRKSKRLSCHVPCRIVVGKEENIACIIDLAKTGCRCIIEGRKNPDMICYEIDSDITLRCIFPDTPNIVSIAAEIKSVKWTRDEYDLGIFFKSGNSSEVQDIIRLFLSNMTQFI